MEHERKAMSLLIYKHLRIWSKIATLVVRKFQGNNFFLRYYQQTRYSTVVSPINW